MVTTEKSLKTGELYTLEQLFRGEHRKIIIPDLQRDYCWGGHEERLVQGFVGNLVANFTGRKPLSLGLLYGYEAPAGHIQLCDGQQRITTLFLLVGMLNRRCWGELQKLLISDFEYTEDDKEPYLQYAIRENSLYFLSDLVCNFFIEDKEGKEIKQTSWYFKEYDNDPSIQSMLTALAEIEEALKPLPAAEWSNFGKYVTTELSFMYYDMGTRAAGEETFVIINTTGEPLSPTENLKPRHVDKYGDAAAPKWEEWETWFWQHRAREKNDTADAGMLEFFRWMVLLETAGGKEREAVQDRLKEGRMEFELIEGLTPETVEGYLDVVKRLFACDFLADHQGWLSPGDGINTQIDWFRLLPLIAWVKKFPDAPERDLERVWQFFNNLARLSRISRNPGELLPQAIGLVEQMTEPDIAKTVYLDGVSSGLLTEEESAKFQIFLDAGQRREEIEDLFWSTQKRDTEKPVNKEGQIWNGQIMPLIEWSKIDGKFDFDEFRRLHDTFYRVFKGECDANIDPVRRALLTRGLKDYPRIFNGYTNHSFGREWSDWKTLIFDNVEPFGTLIRELADAGDIDSSLEEMAVSCPPEQKWAEFALRNELLDFCGQKNIQWRGQEHGWEILRGKTRREKHANLRSYRMYLDLKDSPVWDTARWKFDFWERDQTCAFLDLKEKKIAIDIFHAENKLYTLQLFLRGEPTEAQSRAELGSVAQTFGLDWNGERFESVGLVRPHAEELLKQLCEKL